ncbi:plasminogen-like [Anopheles maculipalpis]|uniref:plasminogen-like n=1 Tax=Anopheles maculipalpis TaxID=1496333 RepID=UPI0021591FE2|nr:plasminogen-like [Anopheles maculipalpis]
MSDTRTFETMEATSSSYSVYTGQRYARNQVLSNENCNQVHSYVYAQQLCTDPYIGGNFCQVIHGGPLAVVDENGPMLIGITNWVYVCSMNNPLAHIRITYFSEWIRRNSDYMFDF